MQDKRQEGIHCEEGVALARSGLFMGATEEESAGIVIYGMSMDYTVSGRPGSRFAPQRIRAVSDLIEEYSPRLDGSLENICYADIGDLILPYGAVDKSLSMIEGLVRSILRSGKFPIGIGGEHLVTLPVIKAFSEAYEDLAVLHLDAHADLRCNYIGCDMSHSTVMMQSLKYIGPESLWQIGIRSGTEDEFKFGKENTHFYPFSLLDNLEKALEEIGDRPVYLTLDIDIVDPAFAPGTGTPEPGGCTSAEILEAIYRLKGRNLVGFDIVEVLPSLDVSDITAVLAAKIIREIIIIAGDRLCDGRG